MNGIDWSGGGWITPAIHIYAIIVFVLTITVYVIHTSRIADLGRRVGLIAGQIEGQPVSTKRVKVEQLTGIILHLVDVVQHRSAAEIAPVLRFVRREEHQRGVAFIRNLVNITETMIELFPMLGIFGTVWGISGVAKENFSSERLLYLFGVATGTTLWALLYVIIFRIAYSALVQSKVIALEEFTDRFQEFLSALETRAGALVDAGVNQERESP